MTPQWHERAQAGRTASRLTEAALELACVVREHDRAGITAHLATIAPADREPLLVVLAALVDVERTPAELLAWVTWDEHGQPLDRSQWPRRIPVGDDVRAAHSAYMRGERTEWAVNGQRAYERARYKVRAA